MKQARKWFPLLLLLVLLVALPALADTGRPDFSAHIYADGVAWGTKVTTPLPAPNEKNEQSFDDLFVFTNGAEGQLLVGDAGPGNPEYNGGRWITWTATWIADLPHDKVVLTSYSKDTVGDPFFSIEFHEELGHLILTRGSPGPPPPPYFSCPLLPVLE